MIGLANAATSAENGAGEPLALALRVIGVLFNCALWAMVVALLFSKWTWFEMRVNVGWVLYGAWILLFVICLWRVKKPFGLVFSLVNTVICGIAIFFLSNGAIGVQIIPASLVREGLHQSQWVAGTVNTALVAFAVVCLVLIAALDVAVKVRSARGQDKA